MNGIIYILTNSAFCGIVKIGYTTASVEQRLAEINAGTGIVEPFQVYAAFSVEDARKTESLIHLELKDFRLKSRKEFFTLKPNIAKEKILKIISHHEHEIEYIEKDLVLIKTTKEFGELIKNHRKKLGLTQAQLRDLVGTGNRFICDLENGKETIQFGLALKVMNQMNVKMAIDTVKK